jgi:acetylornithine/succinyldiaminopimelate/putrescine aminotransferase
MRNRLTIASVLGPQGPGIAAAMQAGRRFLQAHDVHGLLRRVGRQVRAVPAFQAIDKTVLQDSYGGNQTSAPDDFLVGRGLFYLSEQRKLYLDCTSGHYQMLWGYGHPRLCAAAERAVRAGVVWDNHSNIPQAPLKRLAHELVAIANAPGEPDPLDTVLLGICTGSVACAAALKIQLKVFQRRKGKRARPVMVALDGNYHGTDMVAQVLRGMWPGLVEGLEVVLLQPNDHRALETAFRRYGERIAGFWTEPVMMNREAIAVHGDYLHLARRLCDRAGALMCVDEIQTGFWRPEVFDFRALGLRPDLVIAGKGMAAGFHPLSAVIFKHRHDVLAQYDAISTNGSSALPAFLALCSLELLRAHGERIRRAAQQIEAGFRGLAAQFPEVLQAAQGRGHMAGLKFRRVPQALAFQRDLLEAGLWTRAHAYHEGHSTVLTKLGLLADETVIDFVLNRFHRLLKQASVSSGP